MKEKIFLSLFIICTLLFSAERSNALQSPMTAPSRVSDYAGTARYIALGVESNGKIHALWIGNRKTDEYLDSMAFYSSSSDGATWSSYQELQSGDAYDPRIAVDNTNNKVHLVYRSNANGIIHRVVSGGIVSSPATISSDLGVSPEIAVDPSNGYLHALWLKREWVTVNNATSAKDSAYYAFWNGSSWSTPVQAISTTNPGQPEIAVKPGGPVMIAWLQMADAYTGTIKSSYSSDNATFSSPATVSSSYDWPEGDSSVFLTYAPLDGKFHVATDHLIAPGKSDIYHFTWDGPAWSSYENATAGSSDKFSAREYLGSVENAAYLYFTWMEVDTGYLSRIKKEATLAPIQDIGRYFSDNGISINSHASFLGPDGTPHMIVGEKEYEEGGVYYMRLPLLANMSLSPTSKKFSSSSETQTFTLKNSGTDSISISDVSLGGSDASSFAIQSDTCTGTLAASASCTVDVMFAASASGSKKAALNISSNDPYSPLLTAYLTNTGINGYTLTVIKTGTGTVTSSDNEISCGQTCSVSYETATDLVLTATAESGSSFKNWLDCPSDQGNVCWITVDSAKTVTAVFQSASATQYKLTVKKTGSGTVSADISGESCGSGCSKYDPDTAVTLTAAPLDGYKFTGWSGACTGSDTTCTVTMSLNRTVIAKFAALKKYTLKVIKAKGGSVAGSDEEERAVINCGGSETSCSKTYYEGSVGTVTLTATPDAGYKFLGWSKPCSGTGTCTVTVSSSKTITPRFSALKSYTLKVVLGPKSGGSVTSSDGNLANCSGKSPCKGTAAYLEGDDTKVTLTAVPANGKTFYKWTGTSCNNTTEATCELTMNKSQSVKAMFR